MTPIDPLAIEWRPIPERALRARIRQACKRMTLPQKRLWEVIRIDPEKWQQHPYGDAGGGFWAVALFGKTVVWYNDLEEGFNRSRFDTYGTIDEFWCNQDELESTVQYMLNALNVGKDILNIVARRSSKVR